MPLLWCTRCCECPSCTRPVSHSLQCPWSSSPCAGCSMWLCKSVTSCTWPPRWQQQAWPLHCTAAADGTPEGGHLQDSVLSYFSLHSHITQQTSPAAVGQKVFRCLRFVCLVCVSFLSQRFPLAVATLIHWDLEKLSSFTKAFSFSTAIFYTHLKSKCFLCLLNPKVF